jgi:hypothetical protein
VYVVADARRIGGVLFSYFFLLCAQYFTTSVISGQGGERFSALQKPQARGFKGIVGLKTENGVFFRTEVFLDSTFSFFS